ncbi:unnamed protein product [Urochloa humidicola]
MSLDTKFLLEEMEKLFAKQNAQWDRWFADRDAKWNHRYSSRSGSSFHATATEQSASPTPSSASPPAPTATAAPPEGADAEGAVPLAKLMARVTPTAACAARIVDGAEREVPVPPRATTCSAATSDAKYIPASTDAAEAAPFAATLATDFIHCGSVDTKRATASAEKLFQSASTGVHIDVGPSNTAACVHSVCSMYCRRGFPSMLNAELRSPTPTWLPTQPTASRGTSVLVARGAEEDIVSNSFSRCSTKCVSRDIKVLKSMDRVTSIWNAPLTLFLCPDGIPLDIYKYCSLEFLQERYIPTVYPFLSIGIGLLCVSTGGHDYQKVFKSMTSQCPVMFSLLRMFDKEQWPPPQLDCNPGITFCYAQEVVKQRQPWPPPIRWFLQTVGVELRPRPWPSFRYHTVCVGAIQLLFRNAHPLCSPQLVLQTTHLSPKTILSAQRSSIHVAFNLDECCRNNMVIIFVMHICPWPLPSGMLLEVFLLLAGVNGLRKDIKLSANHQVIFIAILFSAILFTLDVLNFVGCNVDGTKATLELGFSLSLHCNTISRSSTDGLLILSSYSILLQKKGVELFSSGYFADHWAILWIPWLFSASLCWVSDARSAVIVIKRAQMLIFQLNLTSWSPFSCATAGIHSEHYNIYSSNSSSVQLQLSNSVPRHILQVDVLKWLFGWCELVVVKVSGQLVGVPYLPILVHQLTSIVVVQQLFLWDPGGDLYLLAKFGVYVQSVFYITWGFRHPFLSEGLKAIVVLYSLIKLKLDGFLLGDILIRSDSYYLVIPLHIFSNLTCMLAAALIHCHEWNVKLHLLWKYTVLCECSDCAASNISDQWLVVFLSRVDWPSQMQRQLMKDGTFDTTTEDLIWGSTLYGATAVVFRGLFLVPLLQMSRCLCSCPSKAIQRSSYYRLLHCIKKLLMAWDPIGSELRSQRSQAEISGGGGPLATSL